MTVPLETPFPYQQVGAHFLSNHRQALLADEMGLGKSCQAVVGADIIGANNILVLCPAAVRINWEREFTRFSPLDRPCAVLLTGKDRAPTSGVVVCSYDLLAIPDSTEKTYVAENIGAWCIAAAADIKSGRPIPHGTPHWDGLNALCDRNLPTELNRHNVGAGYLLLRAFPTWIAKAKRDAEALQRLEKERRKFRKELQAAEWDLLILDEAHYLKERTSDRTRAVYGQGKRSPGLIVRAKRTWRLTGTPAPNDASELYTHLLSAGVIAEPYWDFVFKYCNGYDTGHRFKITGHKNVDELKQLLGRFMLRRKKEEVMTELPPITFQEVTVERTSVDLLPFTEQLRGKTTEQFMAELKLADSTLKAAFLSIKDSKTPFQDRLKVLESMANGNMTTLRRYLGLAKLTRIGDILEEELATGAVQKIVIFGIHKDVIEGCRKRFAKYGAVTLYGGTPGEKRQANIDRFQKDPKCRVFIGNIQAAGTGITLTAAHEVAFIEADWVPANNAQAAMRCHRIGQDKPVRVRFFSCAGSVDEEVMDTLRRKTRELAKLD